VSDIHLLMRAHLKHRIEHVFLFKQRFKLRLRSVRPFGSGLQALLVSLLLFNLLEARQNRRGFKSELACAFDVFR